MTYDRELAKEAMLKKGKVDWSWKEIHSNLVGFISQAQTSGLPLHVGPRPWMSGVRDETRSQQWPYGGLDVQL